LHPEKEPSLAGSEKLACHFSFHMLVLGSMLVLGALRTGAGLVTALELRGALQALTARTAAMTQVIFHLMNLLCHALSCPAPSSRPRPGLG
jgi:hypothetical protein